MEILRRPVVVTVVRQGSTIFSILTLALFALLSAVSAQLDIPLRDDLLQTMIREAGSGNLDYRNVLAKLEFQGIQQCSNNVASQWAYETNVNEFTQSQALEAQQLYSEFQNQAWQLISRLNINGIRDPTIRRRLTFLSIVGPAALPPGQLERYNRVINDMLSIYNSATICAHNDPFRCGLRLYPDLSQIMAKSRDWDELQYVWIEWRRRSGNQMRDLYEQLVDLNNEAASYNNFTNAAEYWMFPYESPDLQQELDAAWNSVRPLYEELHAYVRRKLRDLYGPEKVSRQAPLPSHILGNMWGQSWTNIVDITMPYPGKNRLDVTQEMLNQGYTPIDMFRVAEEFYVSLNLSAMPPEFWASSLFVDPGDRDLVCQASAWDFCNRLDYRIKMCTRVTMKDLITVHHEMAHIQYFLRYSKLPREFRDGANPGFHEAVGEAVALSVATPRHFQAIGLAPRYSVEPSADINYLFALAMDKVVLLPFSLTMDKWRWDLFNRVVNREEYNCHWHRLREQYSGIKPPVLRSEDDFDPGSKYHIPANIPYIRNFVAGILQFQIYRALCQAAGQRSLNDPQKPLHRCDFYGSGAAGGILGRLMEKGSSIPWQETLQEATGEVRLDGDALREFFRPLEDWLRTENLRTGELVGWTYDGDYCKRSIETAGLQVYGSGFYNSAFTVESPTCALLITIISIAGCLTSSLQSAIVHL
ncbi:angiotensin-converting enzyme [Neodiprion pinetum]|uniref:angiotensin-converting enzyme-like n=1 Tax=Neodiprion fabricii TaxID=2872261 RepID=UPI001ED964D9|nr:angiotensin-converting enzyme-like [Neodiprion fabricii]XP_046477188.1 angiotensin-converting enzyme-like [Neodiprion pinetum]